MWIVFEVEIEKHRYWAWCRPSPDPEIAGFDRISMTEPDGFTFADVPEPLPELGRRLFTTGDR